MQLDANGLSLDTVDEIVQRYVDNLQAQFGDEIATGPETPFGVVIGVLANDQRLVQEAIAAAYAAAYRPSSSGVQLDQVGSLTGSTRLGATPSRAAVDVTVSGAFSQAPGTITISVAGAPERTFVNEIAVDFVGAGTASHAFISTDTGPIEAPATTLIVITVPIPALTAVNNPGDAALGTDIETDTAYRARQEEELAKPGTSTLDAIRIDVLNAVVDANGDRLIGDVTVFENTTINPADANGLPIYAIEVLIDDGNPPAAPDSEVFQAVFNAKPGGIQAYGLITGTAIDSRGDVRPSAFTRPTLVDLAVQFTLTTGPDWQGAASITKIQSAIALYWQNTARTGDDLIRSQLSAPFWAAVTTTEVEDIVLIEASRDGAPVAASNVTIAPRERGTLDTADITVVV